MNSPQITRTFVGDPTFLVDLGPFHLNHDFGHLLLKSDHKKSGLVWDHPKPTQKQQKTQIVNLFRCCSLVARWSKVNDQSPCAQSYFNWMYTRGKQQLHRGLSPTTLSDNIFDLVGTLQLLRSSCRPAATFSILLQVISNFCPGKKERRNSYSPPLYLLITTCYLTLATH